MFFASAALLLVLVAMQLGSGVTQQWFEGVHPLDEYAARLVAQAGWLRGIVAVDDVFIAAYTAAAVLAAAALKQTGSPLWGLALAGGVATGLLDLEENHHMLAMLVEAQQGIALSAASLEHRSVLSALKWALGPIAYGLFALGLPTGSRLARTVQLYTWLWVLPLTAAVLAIDDPLVLRPLAFVRLVSVVLGFVSLGVLLRPRASLAAATGGGGANAAQVLRGDAQV
jgi:hypothetical protein